MKTNLLIAIIGGLGGMLGWGVADFFAKKSMTNNVSAIKLIFWVQLIGIIPVAMLFILTNNSNSLEINLNFPDFISLLIFGVFEALGYLLFYKSLEIGKVSIMSPIFASYSAFATIIFIFVFKESYTFLKIFLLIIALGGIWLASVENTFSNIHIKIKKAKGLNFVLGAVLIFSIWFPYWDQFTANKNTFLMLLILRSVASVSIYIYTIYKRISVTLINRNLLKAICVIASFDVLAYASFTWGFQFSTNGSIVAILSAAFSLPSLILAKLFLKEKIYQIQYIGILLIIVAISIIVAS